MGVLIDHIRYLSANKAYSASNMYIVRNIKNLSDENYRQHPEKNSQTHVKLDDRLFQLKSFKRITDNRLGDQEKPDKILYEMNEKMTDLHHMVRNLCAHVLLNQNDQAAGSSDDTNSNDDFEEVCNEIRDLVDIIATISPQDKKDILPVMKMVRTAIKPYASNEISNKRIRGNES